MTQRKTKNGDRVAHATIDSKSGLARTGTVEDVIADGDGGLIAARWDDEPEIVEAFDEREIVPLVGSARGPVVLHPRHLLAIIRHPAGAIALLVAFLTALGLGAVAVHAQWDASTSALVGAAVIVLTLIPAAIASRH